MSLLVQSLLSSSYSTLLILARTFVQIPLTCLGATSYSRTTFLCLQSDLTSGKSLNTTNVAWMRHILTQQVPPGLVYVDMDSPNRARLKGILVSDQRSGLKLLERSSQAYGSSGRRLFQETNHISWRYRWFSSTWYAHNITEHVHG